MGKFRRVFRRLPDRRADNARHDLLEVLFIALAAVLCGAESCSDMADFGQSKEGLLRLFLRLEHGIPSHDTFSRVFRLLKPETFEPSHSAASWPPLPRPMVSTSQAWWQSTARPCAAPTNAAGPPRRCRWSMSLRWMPAWPWLSRKRLVATRRLVPWKCWTFCPSKVALSPPTRCIATARLRPRCASEAATMFWRSRRTAALVHGGCATVRALRQAQPRQARRPVQSRSTRNAPCHCHAQHQLGYPLWFSGRRCGGPGYLAQTPARPACRCAGRAPLSAVQIYLPQAIAPHHPQPLGYRKPTPLGEVDPGFWTGGLGGADAVPF